MANVQQNSDLVMPETPCGTQTLQALLEEAYALTYRDSSLEVRRRYRKLICHLEQRSQATRDKTGDGIKVACRTRRQSA